MHNEPSYGVGLNSHTSGTKIAREIFNMEDFMTDYDLVKASTEEFKGTNWFYFRDSIVTFKDYLISDVKSKTLTNYFSNLYRTS